MNQVIKKVNSNLWQLFKSFAHWCQQPLMQPQAVQKSSEQKKCWHLVYTEHHFNAQSVQLTIHIWQTRLGNAYKVKVSHELHLPPMINDEYNRKAWEQKMLYLTGLIKAMPMLDFSLMLDDFNQILGSGTLHLEK